MKDKQNKKKKIEIIPPFAVKDFIIKENIGHGSFGEIYKGEHKKSKKLVAIKFETRIKLKSYLFFEGSLYKYFH